MSLVLNAPKTVQQVCVRVPATSANLGAGFDVFGVALDLVSEFTLCWEPGTRHNASLQAGSMEKEGHGPAIPWQPVRVTGCGEGSISTEPAYNLACRAVEAFVKYVGPQTFGSALPSAGSLRLTIHNRIPLARGMGSSAAAVVGGLVAANELAGRPLSTEELLDLAIDLEGHPDNVAPALLGGAVVAASLPDPSANRNEGAGGGQRVTRRTVYCRFDPPPGVLAVLAVPRYELSTRAARAVLPDQVPFADAVFNAARASLLSAAFATGRLDLFGPAMEDRLHQHYRADLIPGLAETLLAAKQAGALGAALSGSGPAILALAAGEESAANVGTAMQHAMKQAGSEADIMICALSTQGARWTK